MYCVAEPCEDDFKYQQGNVDKQHIIPCTACTKITDPQECAYECAGKPKCKSYEFLNSKINTQCRLMNTATIDKDKPSGFFNCLKIGTLMANDLNFCYLVHVFVINMHITHII